MNPGLDASYERCRALNREYGRTYYLATRLLPRWKRRHVHALYGFTRYTDNIVDCAADDGLGRADRLRRWADRFLTALSGAPVDDPVLPAVLHTIAVFDLDRADFVAFLRSMEMDLTVDSYRTYDSQVDLAERKGLYKDGGLAAVPGTSDHGWGMAVDLSLDAGAQAWMRQHAGEYGFVEDTPREPWHWGYHP